MSTRGAIVKITSIGEDGTLKFKGRYHHNDGYPKGLGASLFELYQETKGDLTWILRTLIDDHPAGWSEIVGADFGLPPGFTETKHMKRDKRTGSIIIPKNPACYCHGDRHEKEWTITDRDVPWDVEWVYALNEQLKTMHVLTHDWVGDDSDRGVLVEVAVVNLEGPEPDWVAMKQVEEMVSTILGNLPPGTDIPKTAKAIKAAYPDVCLDWWLENAQNEA